MKFTLIRTCGVAAETRSWNATSRAGNAKRVSGSLWVFGGGSGHSCVGGTRDHQAGRDKKMRNVLGGRQRQQKQAQSFPSLSHCLGRTWPVRMGSSRQVRPECVKWTRYGRSHSFPPMFLFFNVVINTYSCGSLLKWPWDYIDGNMSLVCERGETGSIKMEEHAYL